MGCISEPINLTQKLKSHTSDSSSLDPQAEHMLIIDSPSNSPSASFDWMVPNSKSYLFTHENKRLLSFALCWKFFVLLSYLFMAWFLSPPDPRQCQAEPADTRPGKKSPERCRVKSWWDDRREWAPIGIEKHLHRSAKYQIRIKSKPVPGHFARDSNLSTRHLKYLPIQAIFLGYLGAPSIVIHFRLSLFPSWPCMHQSMVNVLYFEESSPGVTWLLYKSHPETQSDTGELSCFLRENTGTSSTRRNCPFGCNESKPSQPRHAASLFLGGSAWPLRQEALSRWLFIGGGGGNSVLKGGVRPCRGKVHLKLTTSWTIASGVRWYHLTVMAGQCRKENIPPPPSFPKQVDELMEQESCLGFKGPRKLSMYQSHPHVLWTHVEVSF